MTARWLGSILLAVAWSLAPAAVEPQKTMAASGVEPTGPTSDRRDDVGAVGPRWVTASTREVRGLAVCGGGDVWAATRGGVEHYVRAGWVRRPYGVDDGLDTLDVRRVTCTGGRVTVETATGLCALEGEVFRCRSHAPSAPDSPSTDAFLGQPVAARVRVAGGEVLGTAGTGLFFAPSSGDPVRLGPNDAPPSSFVRVVIEYGGRTWLGTFDSGLYVVDVSRDDLLRDPSALSRARLVVTPFRMINDATEAGGSLYVAANEGLFVTTDGAHFVRVPQVEARGVTGLSADAQALYVTTTSALWRVRLRGVGPANATWWRPAGSRSLQGLIVERGGMWIASEDRGVIRFDGKKFTAFDRLAGLPTSWVVAVAGDGAGGVFAATLRDGAVHVDGRGRWERLEGLPSDWTLGVARGGGEVCVGTQDGAVCYDDSVQAGTRGRLPSRRLGGLPDARVHALSAGPAGLLVGTEAGIAAYEPSACL